MKKYFYLAIGFIFTLGCINNSSNEPTKVGTGYTDNDTENVKLVKALNDASIAYDTVALRNFYSGNGDSIHINLEGMTLDENIKMIGDLQKQGITYTIERYAPIWETINYTPDEKGVTNYVIAYMILNAKKGDKTSQILFHQVCAIKNKKIVEEWDIYDTKAFDAVLQ